MILVDFSQVAISTLMAELGPQNIESFNESHADLLRHMIFNCLRSYRMKYRHEYGDLVICTDARSWRHQSFAYYKAHRKSDREAAASSWGLIFKVINEVRDDLEKHFPYRVFHIPGAEADDVIAVLCDFLATQDNTKDVFGSKEPVLIISGDKDFIQLQKYSFVKQYNPIQKKWVKPKKDWVTTLKEQVICGDKGDGIPNFRSPDNSFVDKIRQKPITEKNLAKWVGQKPEEFCENQEELNGYNRNNKLINFQYIPEEVREAIMYKFYFQTPGNRRDILNYFIAKRMRRFIELVTDF